MTTTPFYDKILMDLTNGEMSVLQRQVLDVLKSNPGGQTREQLCIAIYGFVSSSNDRKVRLAIGALRDMLVPIVANSGKAGYRLDVSESAIREMMGEWRSRRDELSYKIDAGERMITKIRQAALRIEVRSAPIQMSFAEGR